MAQDPPTSTPRGPRGRLVVGAVIAVVALALLARVDVEAPDDFTIERRTPDPENPTPTPTPASLEREWDPIGTWRRMALAPIQARQGATAVWTGRCLRDTERRFCGQLIVWGGWGGGSGAERGAAYYPNTDSWRLLAESPRRGLDWAALPGVFTGVDPAAPLHADPDRDGELIVWGATNADFGVHGAIIEPRGVAYDPESDAWRALPDAPLSPRIGHSLTWTGSEVLVWGGRQLDDDGSWHALDDGAAYDPATDTWRLLPSGVASPRADHAAVWLPARDEFVVWGGNDGGERPPVADGAVYDLAENRWWSLPRTGAQAVGEEPWRPAAVLEPTREGDLLVVAPVVDDDREPVLLVYDAEHARWRRRDPGPVGLRSGAEVSGSGNHVVVWGGTSPLDDPLVAGAVYYTTTGGWRRAPDGREPQQGETATWTGLSLVVWGGSTAGGATWNPNARPELPARSEPQELGEARGVGLPAGHETNWRLRGPRAGDALTVEVHGEHADTVDVWVSAGSEVGGRAQRLTTVGVTCDGTEWCAHDLDTLPGIVPGRLRLHLRAGDDVPADVRVLPVTR